MLTPLEKYFKEEYSMYVLMELGGGRGAISLSPQCRGYNRALRNEKLSLLFLVGAKRAMVTNDWCITEAMEYDYQNMLLTHINFV